MGFQKAEPKQAALKMALYGPQGSGKTFTALLLAEGLAQLDGKRVAFVDTERGTDFYAKAVPARKAHPEAFDFDALYTRSLTEVLREVKSLPVKEYGVLVLDSMSHLWDAAINSYSGRKTKAGTIPMHAWANIKRPYKDLMQFVVNSPMHVILLGRQGNVFEDIDGKTEHVGFKMRAEGETAYEPHMCGRMEPVRQKDGSTIPAIHWEKDRTGIHQGRILLWPTFANVVEPLLPLLGREQATFEDEDTTAARDAEGVAQILTETILARIGNALDVEALKGVAASVTEADKERMTAAQVNQVKAAIEGRRKALASKEAPPAKKPMPGRSNAPKASSFPVKAVATSADNRERLLANLRGWFRNCSEDEIAYECQSASNGHAECLDALTDAQLSRLWQSVKERSSAMA